MNALSYILSQPWMILPEYLDLMIQVASRERSPEEIAEAIEKATRQREAYDISPMGVAAKRGEPLYERSRTKVREGGVAILPIMGPIFRHANLFRDVSGATSVESLSYELTYALESPLVKSIILAINSPGGEVAGIGQFAQMIAASQKPIVGYGDGMMASAAYYIAAGADEIIIDRSALLGSIGTVIRASDTSQAREKMGIRELEVTSDNAPRKRFEFGSDEMKASLKELANDLEGVFIEDVARFRGVSVKKVKSDFGQGGLLVGQKAIEAGLADRLGSFESLITEMAGGYKRKKRKMRATAEASNTQPEAGENSGGLDMKEKGFFARLFSGMSAEEKQEAAQLLAGEDGKQPAPPAVQAQAPAPQNAEKLPNVAQAAPPAQQGESEETKQLRARIAALEEERFRSAAETFANNEILAGRAMPAEKDSIIAAHVQAAKDDAAMPVATGGKPRVALLAETQSKRPAHTLTREQMKARFAGAAVLPDSDDPEAKAIEEERKETRAYAEKANGKKKTA